MKKPFLVLNVFTVIVSVLCYFLYRWNDELVYNNITYFIIYYYVVSFLSISFFNFAVTKMGSNWMLYYLGSMVVRFFLSVMVAFLFMMLDKQNVVVIGINFVILHLMYLGLDLFIIINKAKKVLRNDQNVGQGT